MSEPHMEKNRPLAELTTFRIGGPADLYCEPKNRPELKQALDYARENRIRHYILGGGSNTLFSDNGYRGLVISTRSLAGIRKQGLSLYVQAGTMMDELNAYCVKEGLSGLEFSGGLPGSAGGAVYMNARAYHREMGDAVKKVTVMKPDGSETDIGIGDIGYGYKQSVFMKDPALVILEIEFGMTGSDPETVRTLTEKNRRDREEKGQYAYPSAGCVFKNDRAAGAPSGQLIDSIGMKGRSVGGAAVYEKHANFIVNKGGAKCSDVIRLIEEIEKNVYEKKGVRLEREVRVVE